MTLPTAEEIEADDYSTDQVARMLVRIQELEAEREKTYKAGYIDGWHEGRCEERGALEEIDSYWKYYLKGEVSDE